MSADDMRFWIWLGVVLFLFYGEPDVWDKLHDSVMSVGVCK